MSSSSFAAPSSPRSKRESTFSGRSTCSWFRKCQHLTAIRLNRPAQVKILMWISNTSQGFEFHQTSTHSWAQIWTNCTEDGRKWMISHQFDRIHVISNLLVISHGLKQVPRTDASISMDSRKMTTTTTTPQFATPSVPSPLRFLVVTINSIISSGIRQHYPKASLTVCTDSTLRKTND